MAESIATHIPFSYERELASSYVDRLGQEDSPLQDRLQALAEQLAGRMNLPDDMVISVHYVDDDAVNAFATLGGHIVVFRGLVDAAPSENALAMVMGHEIAHIKFRDPLVAMGRGVLLGTALAVVTGASGDSVAGRLLGDSGLLTTLHFSRSQETRADRAGLEAVAGYYGHVNDATRIFEHFLQEEQRAGFTLPGLFRTHPASDDRIDRLRSLAKQKGWPQTGEVTPLTR